MTSSSWSFSPMFCSLALKFESLIHFELLLYMVWGKGPPSFFFSYGYLVFPTPCIEKTLLSPLNALGILVKIKWSHVWKFISGLSIPIHHILSLCSFAVSFEIEGVSLPTLLFFLKTVLNIWIPLKFSINWQLFPRFKTLHS